MPASSLDIFHELGDNILAEVAPKEARVQLHVPLQHYVEKHPSLLFFTTFYFCFYHWSWADRRKAGEDRLVLLRAGASTERREIYKHERRCLLRRRRLQVLSSVLTYEGLQRSAQSHAGLAPLFFF